MPFIFHEYPIFIFHSYHLFIFILLTILLIQAQIHGEVGEGKDSLQMSSAGRAGGRHHDSVGGRWATSVPTVDRFFCGSKRDLAKRAYMVNIWWILFLWILYMVNIWLRYG